MRKTLLSVLALVVAFGFGLAPARGQQPALIDGRLEIAGDRGPIEKAKISLVSETSKKAIEMETDKKGRFCKLGLRQGMYRVTVACDGYVPIDVFNIDLGNNARCQLNLKLVPLQEAPTHAHQTLDYSTGRLETVARSN